LWAAGAENNVNNMVDLRTILLLMAVADLALAAALWIGAGRRRDGLIQWASSLVVRACGCGIIALATEPQAGAAALGIGLTALSITLQGAALVTYAKRHLPTWVHSAVVAAVALPTQSLANDPASAALFVGVVLAILSLGAAAIALQLQPPSGSRARVVLVACFAAAGGILLARGLGALFAADTVAAILRPTGLGAVATLAVFAAAIGTTLAFLLLQKERAEGEVQRLATMDPLTGAYNRRTFHEIAERELARARRAGQPLSIVMLDIDNFRAINDKHGSKVGDEVLQRFTDLLRSALRKEDMLVRFGGDEFVVLLPEVPGPGAVVVAGRIRRTVAAAPIEVGAGQFAVTASLGVAARLDEGPESMDGLLDRAGSALSLAKERGRNRVVALSLGRSIAA
jgi:diguanylate cyclase (GGDEF)-like protein